MLWPRYSFKCVMQRSSPNIRNTKPYKPCVQPMAANKNKTTNNTISTVRDVDQPVRHSKSAKSIETRPVSSRAQE